MKSLSILIVCFLSLSVISASNTFQCGSHICREKSTCVNSEKCVLPFTDVKIEQLIVHRWFDQQNPGELNLMVNVSIINIGHNQLSDIVIGTFINDAEILLGGIIDKVEGVTLDYQKNIIKPLSDICLEPGDVFHFGYSKGGSIPAILYIKDTTVKSIKY
ncbi:hypothetical protein CYY_001245 [Polysphondylium violaceum]|uniref:Carbohydrate binding domain-containing protein n=1 Tax=Polysphondylium violaceum TaxID=133409 RepID=A0A8J4Q3H3_9MYCE|nr:hypothetical protein CYY_001245 [Polysphondylium violaceum]